MWSIPIFNRIIEVQYRHVNTLIKLSPSCRTCRRILRQDTHTAVINRLMANKRASTLPSAVCTYKQLTGLEAFIILKIKHPKLYMASSQRQTICLHVKFWRGRRMPSRWDVMTHAITRSMYYNM